MEILHDRGPAHSQDRWKAGSGYLIGGRLVLTVAHNVDYRDRHGGDEQLLVRTIAGSRWTARVVLVCDERSQVDLALLEITSPEFDDDPPPVSFAQVNRDNPAPVADCWAVGFPRSAEAGAVLSEGSRRDTSEVRGEILPGAKLRAGLLSFQVTSTPQSLQDQAESAWQGMSGAVVFATDELGSERAVGVVSAHHRPEGESALTVVPVTAITAWPAAAQWWHELGVPDAHALPVLPRLSVAEQQRSRLAGELALKEHWDPRGRGVERAARPGWFFTGRRQALSEMVAWLTAAPDPTDNVRVVTGGPGSGKSAVVARLVTMSDPRCRSGMPGPPAADDPAADLPAGALDVAVHARSALTGEVVSALAAAAGASQADADGLTDRLLKRRETFTIAVDALDEADDPRGLARMLRRLASETADAGVRLLIGTRPGGPDRRLITDLGLSAHGDDSALIDLDLPAYLDIDDLADYVRRRLLLTGVPPGPGQPDTPYRGREALAGQVAEAVASAAYPAFLIGQLVSRALVLRGHPLSPGDAGWREFPTTVAAAMDDYLASVAGPDGQDRVEDLLRPLAYARGDGLPLDDAGLWPRLATALARPGRSYQPGDVATLLDTAADYLVESVLTGQASYYRLYHQALSDRLRERDQQRAQPAGAMQTIYHCLLDTVTAVPPGEGMRRWGGADPYVLRHVVQHAADAGRLDELLTDPGFLVHADPATLIASLPVAVSESAQLTAAVYRTSVAGHPRGSPTGRRDMLAVDAARFRASTLLRGLVSVADVSGSGWRPRWATGGQLSSTALRATLAGHKYRVAGVACAELGDRRVAVTVGWDGTLRIWDLLSGTQVGGPLTSSNDNLFAVACTELDGRPIAVTGGRDQAVRVWDLAGRTQVGEPIIHNEPVSAVACTELGGRPVAVTAGRDAAVRIWDLGSRTQIGDPLTGHDTWVQTVACTELDGRPIAVTAGRDGAVRIWDLGSRTQIGDPLTGHTGWIETVACRQLDGRPIAISGDTDGGVRMWDLRQRIQIGDLPTGRTNMVGAVACAQPDGQPVAVASGEVIQLWDPSRRTQVGDPLIGHTDLVTAVACTLLDGQPVAVTGSMDETVRLWDLAPGRRIGNPLTGHTDLVTAVAWAQFHDAYVAVTGDTAGMVQLWELSTGTAIGDPIPAHTGKVSAIACTELHGRPVAVTRGWDHTVRVWDLSNGKPVGQPLTGYANRVSALACAQLGGEPVAATAGVNTDGHGVVRVRRLVDGAVVGRLMTGHLGMVEAVACTQREGRPVAVTAGGDSTIRVWDLATGAAIGDPIRNPLPGIHVAEALACTEIDDRPVAVTAGGRDCTVVVWDLITGAIMGEPLIAHTDWVTTVACTQLHDRPVAVTAGHDRTVRIWDLRAGRQINWFELPGPASAVDITPSGDIMAAIGWDLVCLEQTTGE